MLFLKKFVQFQEVEDFEKCFEKYCSTPIIQHLIAKITYLNKPNNKPTNKTNFFKKLKNVSSI